MKLSLGLVINWKLYRKDNRIIYHLEYLEIEEYSDGSGTPNFGFLGTWNHQKRGFRQVCLFLTNLLNLPQTF